jgi:hypothetical protein
MAWAIKILMLVRGPRSGKMRFKLRTLNNWVFVLLLFTLLAFAFKRFLPPGYMWLADGVAIAVLFYLFFFIWDKRAIKICCPHCFKYIRSNTPWVCGFCHKKNVHTDEFPFVNRCEHEDCGAEPRAYKCHHGGCEKLIFLTEDRLEENYASRADAPVEDKAKKEVAFQEQEKRAKEHEITMVELNTKLDEKLKASKLQREFSRTKSPRESVKEKFEGEFADVMAAEEFADEQETFYEEKYKDDPVKLQRVKDWIKDWRTRHT